MKWISVKAIAFCVLGEGGSMENWTRLKKWLKSICKRRWSEDGGSVNFSSNCFQRETPIWTDFHTPASWIKGHHDIDHSSWCQTTHSTLETQRRVIQVGASPAALEKAKGLSSDVKPEIQSWQVMLKPSERQDAMAPRPHEREIQGSPEWQKD